MHVPVVGVNEPVIVRVIVLMIMAVLLMVMVIDYLSLMKQEQ